ncbi:MAG: hypothetical protein KGI75_14125 [Rhizobiaceae bacterium]|nr:hypothetical protein [Rhizobiaceae bacterium]
MNRCCGETVGAIEHAFLQKYGAIDNATELAKLTAVLEKYRRLAGSIRIFSELRVADIPAPAAAMIMRAKCPVCADEQAIIVVSSAILLAIEQLVSLYGSVVLAWDQEPKFRELTDADFAAFEQIIADFVERGAASFSHIAPTMERAPRHVRAAFEKMIDVAKAWVVAHELAHFYHSSFMFSADPNFMETKHRIETLLERAAVDQGDLTKENWAVELFADAVATDTLAIDLQNHHDDIPALERLLGGVGAALEVIYRLEIAVIGLRCMQPDFVPKHPPAALRWDAICGGREAKLAAVLGTISQKFATQAQSTQGLAPLDRI